MAQDTAKEETATPAQPSVGAAPNVSAPGVARPGIAAPTATASAPPNGPNPEQLLTSLNTTAQRIQSLWISFISFGAYLTITVLGTTHRMLLLEEGVKLPIFNIDLPLTKFYLIAPAFLLIFHFYVLGQLMLLARLAAAFNAAVEATMLNDTDRDAIRMRLDNSVFLQLLSGAAPERHGSNRWLIQFTALLTIVFLPVVLFLLIQLQFLPYQDAQLTTFHRILLTVDMAMVLVLWPFYTQTGGLPSLKPFFDNESRQTRQRSVRRVVRMLIVPAMVAVFSWCIATMPAESLYSNPITRLPAHSVAMLDRISKWPADPPAFVPGFVVRQLGETAADTSRYITSWRDKPREAEDPKPLETFSFTELLFELRVDYVASTQLGFFSNRIVLPGQSLSNEKLVREADDAEKNTKPGEQRTVHQFRGRYLLNAVLAGADLRRSDFTGAHLEGATLEGASLHRSRFGCADRGRKVERQRPKQAGDQKSVADAAAIKPTKRADETETGEAEQAPDETLECSLLNATRLTSAKLTGADLRGMDLSGIRWAGVELQGAFLRDANLSGARLDRAQLQNAILLKANLKGANLTRAQMQGTSLNDAELHGAILTSASMQGASLVQAGMVGAAMSGVNLTGANLEAADLRGASLSRARFFAAKLDSANLTGSILTAAHLEGASLENTSFELALLRQLRVWRTSENPLVEDFLVEGVKLTETPFEAGQFAEWREAQAKMIDNEAVRTRVNQALAVLDPAAGDPRNATVSTAWTGRHAKTKTDEDYNVRLVSMLADLSCDPDAGRYIVRRFLVAQRFVSTAKGKEILERFRKAKEPEQSGGEARCPGAIGLSNSDFSMLTRQMSPIR